MSQSIILHLNPSEATRSLVASTQRRVAPDAELVQLQEVGAAQEALDAGETFDLVLVAQDLEEPGDGLDFVKWVREEHPMGPPIYILEEKLEPCFIVDAVAMGVEGVLPTGDPAAFADALADLLSLHVPAAQARMI